MHMPEQDPFVVVQTAIQRLVNRAGSLRAAARVLEIDAGYLCRLRAGDKVSPDDALLRKLGLRRVTTYRRILE